MKQNSDISISWLRARQQRSGTVHYFLELPSNVQRVEIALGPDVEIALKKRAKLLFAHFSTSSGPSASYELILDWYRTIVVPTLAAAQKNENVKSIERLTAFLGESGFGARDISKFESEYLKWRDSRLTLRARSEISLFFKIIRWHQDMLKAANVTASDSSVSANAQ